MLEALAQVATVVLSVAFGVALMGTLVIVGGFLWGCAVSGWYRWTRKKK